jgi:hypothetical protein
MSDLIDRQQTIEAICMETCGVSLKTERCMVHCTEVQAVEKLPPANCSEIPNNSDTISRQAAIEVIGAVFPVDPMKSEYAQGIACGAALAKTYVEQLPSAQPDIIRCRNCKFASGDSRICMKFGHSPIGELDFCAWAERRTDE